MPGVRFSDPGRSLPPSQRAGSAPPGAQAAHSPAVWPGRTQSPSTFCAFLRPTELTSQLQVWTVCCEYLPAPLSSRDREVASTLHPLLVGALAAHPPPPSAGSPSPRVSQAVPKGTRTCSLKPDVGAALGGTNMGEPQIRHGWSSLGGHSWGLRLCGTHSTRLRTPLPSSALPGVPSGPYGSLGGRVPTAGLEAPGRLWPALGLDSSCPVGAGVAGGKEVMAERAVLGSGLQGGGRFAVSLRVGPFLSFFL